MKNIIIGSAFESDPKEEFMRDILNKAEDLLMKWAEQNEIHIFTTYFFASFRRLEVYVFYDFDGDKEKYERDGSSGKIQQMLLEFLDASNYFSYASKNTKFEFDSNQNVLINYHGNYGLRLH